MFMFHLLARQLSYLSAIVTAASVFISVTTTLNNNIKAGLIFVIALAVFLISWDIVEYLKNRPEKFLPNSHQIVEFMNEWVSCGGRTAILSGDLSWAKDNPEAIKFLEKKAKAKDLILCVRTTNELIEYLVENGAELHNYSKYSFSPKSRFTVIDYEKNGERIAVGFVEDNNHVIYKYDTKDSVVTTLACDLMRLLRSSC